MPSIFSAHFWFSKTGKSPLFLDKNPKSCPYTSSKFLEKWARARFPFLKVAKIYPISKGVRTLFTTSKHARTSYQATQSVPRSRNLPNHKYQRSRKAACETVRLLCSLCFAELRKRSGRNNPRRSFWDSHISPSFPPHRNEPSI